MPSGPQKKKKKETKIQQRQKGKEKEDGPIFFQEKKRVETYKRHAQITG